MSDELIEKLKGICETYRRFDVPGYGCAISPIRTYTEMFLKGQIQGQEINRIWQIIQERSQFAASIYHNPERAEELSGLVERVEFIPLVLLQRATIKLEELCRGEPTLQTYNNILQQVDVISTFMNYVRMQHRMIEDSLKHLEKQGSE